MEKLACKQPGGLHGGHERTSLLPIQDTVDQEAKAMIDLSIDQQQLERTVQRVRERNIIIPTFEQMKHPSLTPDGIKAKLRNVGLWEIDSLNLFRIT